MSEEGFLELIGEESRVEGRPPRRRRSSMRRQSQSFSKSGNVTVRVVCLAGGVVFGFGVLLYTSVIMSPALWHVIVKDAMCDPMMKASSVAHYHMPTYVNGTRVLFPDGALACPCPTLMSCCIVRLVGDSDSTTDPSNGVKAAIDASNSSAPSVRSHSSDNESQKITVLLGVLTMASKIERRNLLRLAYGVQSSQDAQVTLRFVLGKPKTGQESTLVGMESLQYGDIIVLDCEENLNEGKTFNYFSTVAAMGIHYDYVMKVDDDSYVRIENLGTSLREQPRNDVYYGYILPCENTDPYAWYMAGMGYLISWDLVQWIHDSPIPRNNTKGTEDKLLGDWLNAGGKAKTRVNRKPQFYDHPEFGGRLFS